MQSLLKKRLVKAAGNFVIRLRFRLWIFGTVYMKYKFRWYSLAQGNRMISSGLHTILMCDAIFSALRQMRTCMYPLCKSKAILKKKKKVCGEFCQIYSKIV